MASSSGQVLPATQSWSFIFKFFHEIQTIIPLENLNNPIKSGIPADICIFYANFHPIRQWIGILNKNMGEIA